MSATGQPIATIVALASPGVDMDKRKLEGGPIVCGSFMRRWNWGQSGFLAQNPESPGRMSASIDRPALSILLLGSQRLSHFLLRRLPVCAALGLFLRIHQSSAHFWNSWLVTTGGSQSESHIRRDNSAVANLRNDGSLFAVTHSYCQPAINSTAR